MSARLRLVLSEAWSSITSNMSTTFAAVMTVLIGMLLLGMFLALGTWVLSWGQHLKKQLDVRVFISNTATQQQKNQLFVRLNGDSLVQHVRFVSKAEALRTMQRQNPDLTRNLPGNPLPDGFFVTPTKGEQAEALYKELQASKLPGVTNPKDDVIWSGKTGRRVLSVAKIVSLLFLIAVVLLVAASTLLIANTIRLSIFARRREVEVMKLVGATNWFIRGPFMLEGLICGLGGSIVAVILLVLGKTIALPAILPKIGGSNSDVHALPFALNATCMIGAGLLLGALGSGLTLRRFLQV